ncbi:hypothetical protein [Acidisphaera sp. L21]|uniref:hypothetical protein n=1 Tax=Acidisphaera sp. L21 TaxID=1641851 RepID=UPI00131EB133|nr:hypothetical protein [Acidisphaera sp. L21]
MTAFDMNSIRQQLNGVPPGEWKRIRQIPKTYARLVRIPEKVLPGFLFGPADGALVLQVDAKTDAFNALLLLPNGSAFVLHQKAEKRGWRGWRGPIMEWEGDDPEFPMLNLGVFPKMPRIGGKFEWAMWPREMQERFLADWSARRDKEQNAEQVHPRPGPTLAQAGWPVMRAHSLGDLVEGMAWALVVELIDEPRSVSRIQDTLTLLVKACIEYQAVFGNTPAAPESIVQSFLKTIECGALISGIVMKMLDEMGALIVSSVAELTLQPPLDATPEQQKDFRATASRYMFRNPDLLHLEDALVQAEDEPGSGDGAIMEAVRNLLGREGLPKGTVQTALDVWAGQARCVIVGVV